MSDPFKPNSNDKNLEKAAPEDGPEKPEIAPEYKPGAKQADSKEQDPNLSKLDLEMTYRSKTSYTFPLGQKPSFVLKKSDFLKPEEDKAIQEYRPLISNFLHDTPLDDEHKLSVAELKELYKNREALSSAKSLQDAVNTALQLTRLYQHLRQIEEAKKARDLLLGLDPNHQLGRQLFKEIEKMHPHELAVSPKVVASPTNALSKRALRLRINQLSGGRVIVLGDLLIDELLEGKPERISREAPVLILEHCNTELILGGAANTAGNLAAFGATCHAIGITGRDEYAKKLARLFEIAGITYGLIEDPSRPTTVKTRILSSAHALRQQLLRLDRISHQKVSSEISERVLERLQNVARDYDAVILSDYKSGVISNELVAGALEISKETGLKVIVDAQNDFDRFKGATLITPNQPDTEAAIGFKIDSPESLERAGQDMLRISGSQSVLLTRGGEGMALFQHNAPKAELPAFNRSEVFDVTGAGDTVVATMTLALVTGATPVEAMALGNLAASIVVRKTGTAVTNQKEMLEALDSIKVDALAE